MCDVRYTNERINGYVESTREEIKVLFFVLVITRLLWIYTTGVQYMKA